MCVHNILSARGETSQQRQKATHTQRSSILLYIDINNDEHVMTVYMASSSDIHIKCVQLFSVNQFSKRSKQLEIFSSQIECDTCRELGNKRNYLFLFPSPILFVRSSSRNWTNIQSRSTGCCYVTHAYISISLASTNWFQCASVCVSYRYTFHVSRPQELKFCANRTLDVCS